MALLADLVTIHRLFAPLIVEKVDMPAFYSPGEFQLTL